MKYKAELSFIPKDSRTLLHSNSTKVFNLREVHLNGMYYNFGLRNGILRFSSILPLQESIQIAVGIDGLPISKSSSSQFWPLLCPITNMFFLLEYFMDIKNHQIVITIFLILLLKCEN